MTGQLSSALTLDDYVGLDRATGAAIAGVDHLVQSQTVLLTTPIGTRVMRRDVGCDLPIDQPQTAGLTADIVASVAAAIIAWEPRETLRRVRVTALQPGGFGVGLDCEVNGLPLKLDGVL